MTESPEVPTTSHVPEDERVPHPRHIGQFLPEVFVELFGPERGRELMDEVRRRAGEAA